MTYTEIDIKEAEIVRYDCGNRIAKAHQLCILVRERPNQQTETMIGEPKI